MKGTCWALAARKMWLVVIGMTLLSLAGCGESVDELDPLESIQRLPPVLTGVTPTNVASGDTITITGRLLNGTSPAGSMNDIYFPVVVSGSVTEGSAKLVIPENVPPGVYNFRYATNGRQSPEIIQITVRRGVSAVNPDTAFVNQEIVVTGTYTAGTANNQLSLVPVAGGTPISLPILTASASQIVAIIPPSLPLGRYRPQVQDTKDNLTLTTRAVLAIQTPGTADVYFAGDVAASGTPGRFTIPLVNGTDSTHHYEVLLVNVADSDQSIVGVTSVITGITKSGSTAQVEFRPPTGIRGGTYRVRLFFSNKPKNSTKAATITSTFWAPTSVTI